MYISRVFIKRQKKGNDLFNHSIISWSLQELIAEKNININCYHKERQATKRRSLLLLLSHFSRVRPCATPQTAAHQAPPSLGFSRQEHWSGLPFPSPMCESELAQSYLILHDCMDCSLPGSSIHGIFQARVLEQGKEALQP